MLAIYNSLSRRKEKFIPIVPGHVRVYVCGMTVYDYCHLGHARVMVVFDMVVRYLRTLGYQVSYIRNITDIDDKIIARANANGESAKELTERYIDAMHEDIRALNVLSPDSEPKATEHIAQIIAMIDKLLAQGYGYQAANNDIYFDVSKYVDYGKLSGRKLAELRAGERVAVNDAKQDPLDFVLWKSAKPQEPSWDSPWGPGRPGWHIECSAMSTHLLGEHFDIHGGGQDLQFPHHENEIAQSVCANGGEFVNFWMHNGFVRVGDAKMSKSLNNFFTVRSMLKDHTAEVIRFFMLSSHYRSPLNYYPDHLREARASLTRLYHSLRDLRLDQSITPDAKYVGRFNAVMDDDFNSPEAIALLHELSHALNKVSSDSEQALRYATTLKHLGGVLGILGDSPTDFLQRGARGESIPEDIEAVVLERDQARSAGDYARADVLRDQLVKLGVTLEDTPTGTVWRCV